MSRICPACTRTCPAGKYLCTKCWFRLTDGTRRALNRRGNGAIQRLQQLLDQIRAGVPLADVRIE